MSTAISGHYVRHADFPGEGVLSRHIDVWTPPDYEESDERYPVIYMHDGQNLFHGDLSYSGIPWGVDQAAARLAAEGEIQMPIIVGIWNTEQRVQEYMPQKPLEAAPVAVSKRFADRHDGPPCSDAYLKFIVKELKSFIDTTYRTLPEQKDTFVMGSSMGGVISLYALCEYPDVFRGAACLSPSWTVAGGSFIAYLQRSIPSSGSHKVYLDAGSEAEGAVYKALMNQAATQFRAIGYEQGENLISKTFPGASHSEEAWGERVDEPLKFMMSG